MTKERIFEFIVDDIHTVVAATSEGSLPVTCAIDIMDWDGGGLYFLTAKGKSFYSRLEETPYISLTGIKGEDTMHRIAVTVRGKVRPEGAEVLARLIQRNAYMREIYPTERSREALEAFCIYEGSAEWFDLSKRPIERFTVAFGGAEEHDGGYFVEGGCISCGRCLDVCPQNCITLAQSGAVIAQEHCLRCGNCMTACPVGAIQRR